MTVSGWSPYRITKLNAPVLLFETTLNAGGEFVAEQYADGIWDLRVADRSRTGTTISVIPGQAALDSADLWSLAYVLTALKATIVATGSTTDALVPVGG
jgi:hypothetical protein